MSAAQNAKRQNAKFFNDPSHHIPRYAAKSHPNWHSNLFCPLTRDELIGLMTASVDAMPGCLSYVVAKDATDENLIWVTEVWGSAESHKASLALPAVAETIKKAMPLIAGFGQHTKTQPVGGYGL